MFHNLSKLLNLVNETVQMVAKVEVLLQVTFNCLQGKKGFLINEEIRDSKLVATFNTLGGNRMRQKSSFETVEDWWKKYYIAPCTKNLLRTQKAVTFATTCINIK